MREVKAMELVSFPDVEITENFEFTVVSEMGNFNFHFQWFSNRWNCWVTFPDGTKKQAGVYPNVISWTGNPTYGLVFSTPLPEIDFNSLFLTELYIIQWL
jgi:hypothetical protein